MNVSAVFKYCPRCGNGLKARDILLECESCGLHYYLNPKPGTTAVLKNETGEYLLVRRAREPKKGLWDLPGGFLELNETYEEGVQRELQEELGVRASNLHYSESVIDEHEHQSVRYPVSVAVFTGSISTTLPIQARDDIDAYKFFSLDDIPMDDIGFRSVHQILSKLKTSQED